MASDILQRHVPDWRVIAFGSRATWTTKEYFDVDLAILGDEPLPLGMSSILAECFMGSELPLKIDLIDWARLDSDFGERIRRDGVNVQTPGKQFQQAHEARLGLRKADIGLVEIPLSPLPEQSVIAQILGTLNDKVELNRGMNTTLERMACTLFKDWFVDFGPVRAKMEGRDTKLPKEVADLLPDRLVDSDFGGDSGRVAARAVARTDRDQSAKVSVEGRERTVSRHGEHAAA